MVYQVHYPGRSMQTARGVKRSAVHDRLAARGAYFRDVSGWEGADWYEPDWSGDPAKGPDPGELSWGRQRWFDFWAAEHRAVREGVGLMDMSFMSKFLVEGPDSARLLQQLSANDVAGEPGVLTYTPWLNEDGTVETDLTVTRLAEDRFWVVASDTVHRKAHTWMRRHAEDLRVGIVDVTSGYAQLNVQGPLSREVLAAVTSADVSGTALPYRGAKEIDLGLATALCIRITYLGELGYELYVPADMAVHAYDRLVEAGAALGMRHTGLRALSSLRLEKAYRDYGHDVDNTDSVLEVGLGFVVALDKPGGFLGRDAVLRQKEQGGLRRRLVQVLVQDPEPLLFHAEPLLRDGVPVGYLRAGSYGFTLGGAVGLAMVESDAVVDAEYLRSADWQVDIAGRRWPATVSLRPMYDPDGLRVRD
jgi:4-methylaminobutanoate oxidase (formaldehyde-forming)